MPTMWIVDMKTARSIAAEVQRLQVENDELKARKPTRPKKRPGPARKSWVTDGAALRFKQTPFTSWDLVYKLPTVASHITQLIGKRTHSLEEARDSVKKALQKRRKRDMKDQEGKKENVI